MKTIIQKDLRYGWSALTEISLGRVPAESKIDAIEGTTERDRILRIYTSKAMGGDLVTRASVHHSNHPYPMVHAFGFGGVGDYSHRMEANMVRVTEKVLEAQHDRCTKADVIAALKAAITAHYAKEVSHA
jgi:hypothetical protein